MAADQSRRSLEDTALASKAFLDGVTALAAKHNLSRGLVISLLGMFAKHVIALDVQDGDSEAEATTRAIGQFMRGAGFEPAPADDAGGLH